MEIWGNVHLPRESTETTHKQFCPAAKWHRGIPTCSACLLEPEPHTAVLLNCTSHHFDARTPQFHVISDILFLTACFRLIFKQLNSTCYIDLQPSELIFDYFFKRSPFCTISRSHFVAVVAEIVDEKYPTELGAGRLGSGSCAGR